MLDALLTKLLGQFIELRNTQIFKRLENFYLRLYCSLFFYVTFWKTRLGVNLTPESIHMKEKFGLKKHTQTHTYTYILYYYILYILYYILYILLYWYNIYYILYIIYIIYILLLQILKLKFTRPSLRPVVLIKIVTSFYFRVCS